MIRFYHWPVISSQMKNEKAQNFCFSLGWLTSCISVAGLKMPESWWGTVSGTAVTVSLEEINACIWVLVSPMQAAVILISWGPAENERAEEGWIYSLPEGAPPASALGLSALQPQTAGAPSSQAFRLGLELERLHSWTSACKQQRLSASVVTCACPPW